MAATNHRLGLMGFLYLGEMGGEEFAASGNQELPDISNGLKWVLGNIEAFSGAQAESCSYSRPAAVR